MTAPNPFAESDFRYEQEMWRAHQSRVRRDRERLDALEAMRAEEVCDRDPDSYVSEERDEEGDET